MDSSDPPVGDEDDEMGETEIFISKFQDLAKFYTDQHFETPGELSSGDSYSNKPSNSSHNSIQVLTAAQSSSSHGSNFVHSSNLSNQLSNQKSNFLSGHVSNKVSSHHRSIQMEASIDVIEDEEKLIF